MIGCTDAYMFIAVLEDVAFFGTHSNARRSRLKRNQCHVHFCNPMEVIVMSKLHSLVLPVILILLATAGLSADEAAVRNAVDAYADAFNKKDLEAVSAMWAAQATHVDRTTGDRIEGRDKILEDIAMAFKERPKTRLVAQVDRVRLITTNVASVEGQTSVGSPGEEPSLSAFSCLLVNNDGKWVIHSIDEMPLPTPATSYDALRDLEWLVGRWVDQSDAVRVDTTFRWTAERAFLLRSFSVQIGDTIARQGTQVIGWDPRSRQIRSWSFNSDGSFGDGTWSQSGDDWLIKSSQTLADGRAASGTYVLTRVDKDAIMLQLIGHEIEGEPQPTSVPVRVNRVVIDEQQTADN
jgi:uncharacterized protein (TIGR02246 family)